MPCAENFVSWLPNQTVCTQCPAEGINCFNQSFLQVKPGFFRPDDNDPMPVRCPYEQACLGGSVSGTPSCQDGQSGPFCAECTSGWYRSDGDEVCTQCGPDLIEQHIGLVVVVVIILIVICARYLRNADGVNVTRVSAPTADAQGKRYVPCMSQLWGAFDPCDNFARLRARVPPGAFGNAASILKVLIAYCQIMGTLGGFRQVVWPPIVNEFWRLFSYINLNLSVLPLNCMFGTVSFFTRQTITIAAPIVGSFVIFFLAAITSVGKQDAEGRPWGARLGEVLSSPQVWTLHGWLLLLSYPTLCHAIMSTFDCVGLRDRSLLRADVSIECYQGSWWAWGTAGIVEALVFCIGMPVGAFFAARRHRNSRGRARQRVLLLINSYRYECWYWESIDLVRKWLLTSVVLIVVPDTTVQLGFGLIITASSCLICALPQGPNRSRAVDPSCGPS